MKPEVVRGAALLTFLFTLAAHSSGAQMIPLLTLPGTPSLGPPKDPAAFTFIVAGDSAPATPEAAPTATLRRLAQRIQATHPAFAVFLGDTVYGGETRKRELMVREYGDFLEVVDRTGVTAFNAPGEREEGDEKGQPDAHAQLWYGQLMNLPFGAFSYGNSRFIVLNTEEFVPGAKGATGAPAVVSGLSEPQLNALHKELDADRDRAHVFIFMHRPLRPRHESDRLQAANAEALVALFRGYRNISFVVAGHENLFYNPEDPANVTTIAPRTDPSDRPPAFLVSGGAGAAPSERPEQGGFHHYLQFRVNGARVEVAIVRLDQQATR